MIALTPELRDRVARERQAQGLPATVEDPVALARVAALLASDRDTSVSAPMDEAT